MNDTKIKFEKPVFFAQNSGEGSFSAGCGASSRGNGNGHSCMFYCLKCERTV